MYADVLIEYNAKSLDKTFTYIIPENIKNLKVGMKVLVPFGTILINGFVTGIKNEYKDEYELKEIARVVDNNLILTKELMELGKYIKETTLCSLITAYQSMLPSSLKIKDIKTSYQLYDEYIYLNENININTFTLENKRKTRQIEIIDILIDKKEALKRDYAGVALNNLIKHNIVSIEKRKKTRINPVKEKIDKYVLTKGQEAAIIKISASLNKNEIFLLHGVTGSGKTEVYLNLIDKVINSGKSALMLVPEISLTAQTLKYFYDWFGNNVAILHSGLSDGERYDEYLKILNKEVSVVVGTRSAVFAPLENLGIIIMDEEHSESYKQENNPRYHAVDIAKYRSKYNNIPLVLGSATPSLESYARSQKSVYTLVLLTKRINDFNLPDTLIIDMAEELKNRNVIFSSALVGKIDTRLKNKEQIILLLNRRGFSTIITCQNCGYTYKCPHCEIAYTYHKSSDTMRCHYCGFSKKKDNLCEKCHEKALKDYGLGTEKLEEEILKIFPYARVVRMDTDTTSKKGTHAKIINEFSEHKYDILLGTQMIAKGLDFKNVSLVGIINADSTLNIPDFRSAERTFDLLTQVSGRAGRHGLPGEVILQTFNPDNYALKCVKENNYHKFYKLEMDLRKKLMYPPYCYLISIKVASKDYNLASKESSKINNYLKKNLKNMIILGPTTASMFRVNNIYRFQIIIKYKQSSNLFEVLKELDDVYGTNKEVNLEIDTSPYHI